MGSMCLKCATVCSNWRLLVNQIVLDKGLDEISQGVLKKAGNETDDYEWMIAVENYIAQL